MEIRFAQARDVPGILSLLRQIGSLHHQGRPDLFRSNAQKYSASQVLSMLDSPTNPIFVALEQEQVVGYGFCKLTTHFRDPVCTDYTNLFIEDLCVDEAFRRQHIGTALYRQILRYGKLRKCHNVTLNVWACNPTAIKFYESLGLTPQKICMETLLEET